MRLYHFTCTHGRVGIGTRGLLKPSPQVFGPTPLVWLTERPWPDRFATGLTSERLTCDRMEYRYVITDTGECVPWLGSPYREEIAAVWRADLEAFGDVEAWWVTAAPVRARLG